MRRRSFIRLLGGISAWPLAARAILLGFARAGVLALLPGILLATCNSRAAQAQQADLALTKSVSNPTPNVGGTITFTVALSNQGPDQATGVIVQETLPAGVTFVSATPSQGSYSSGTGVWTVGAVANGASATLQLQATVISPNPQTNRASISHSDPFDPDSGNNTAAATITPQQADLLITKSVSNPTPNVGDTITYTVTLSNSGPATATNVTVQDTLPAAVSLVSASPSQGSYVSNTGVWSVGTVLIGPSPTLTITAHVNQASPGPNTASISHSDQFDPNTANNSAATSTNPQAADLALAKRVNIPTPNVGDTVTFTVTLSNSGPSNATNVTMQDLLPAGLTFVSASPSQGNYNSGSGVWTLGTVANGASATLQLLASVASPNPATNTASISHSDQFDPNTGNNTATATVTPQAANLQVTKSATPRMGANVRFIIALNNLGPSAATNVTVQDVLPAGLTLVAATPTQGSYVSNTGVWSVGTVTTSIAPTLTITASVTSPNPSTNAASITHSDQFDPITTNNSASVTVRPTIAHDFNNDGFSDILLENTGGGIAMWLMGANATVQSAVGVGATTNVWTIIGQRDINGDGKGDILFRATDGSIAEWLMNAGTITSANGLGNPTTAWTIVGTGDFNGDGIGDVLFRGGGTAVALWYMNSAGGLASAIGVGSLPSDWIVVGAGDFDGDGVRDILWLNNSSKGVAVWLMNANGTVKSAVAVGSLPAGWSIAGSGDFNGDNISDILLSNTGNGVAIWFMNSSGGIASAQGVATMAPGWTIAQTGDFNGDGKSDVLLYHSASGTIGAWLMNGATITSFVGVGSLPPSAWMLVTANSE
jgi:uncharacterized repeat protein (TIGR01451 family)